MGLTAGRGQGQTARRPQEEAEVVDQTSLQRLADVGIAAFPPGQMDELAVWCWDYGIATGDARWCALWRLIAELVSAWGKDMELGVPPPLVDRWDQLLTKNIPEALALPSPAACILVEDVRRAVSVEAENPC
jgi:hypothetical protein